MTDPLSHSTSFIYDDNGQVLTQTLADGREIAYSYDEAGNIVAITPPGKPAHTFDYNAANLETTYLPPDIGLATTETQYGYNIDKQLTQITRPDGKAVLFDYDTGGRLAYTTIERGGYSYAYSSTTGNLTTITAPDGGTIDYEYDGSLLLTTT